MPDPYFVSAMACFRPEKREYPYLVPEMNAEDLRKRNRNATEKALSILEYHSSKAVEVLTPIISVEGREEYSREGSPTWEERIVVAHTLALLSDDHPEVQNILLEVVPPPSDWNHISERHYLEQEFLHHLILALGRVSNASVSLVRMLLEAINSPNDGISYAGRCSIRGLMRPSHEAIDLLMQMYPKYTSIFRVDLLEAIGTCEQPTDEIVGVLIEALKSKDDDISSVAAKHLGNLKNPDKKVINFLISYLKKSCGVAEALGKLVLGELPFQRNILQSKLEKISEILRRILLKEDFYSYTHRNEGLVLVFEAFNNVAEQLVKLEIDSLPIDLRVSNNVSAILGGTEGKIRLAMGVLLSSILGVTSNIVASYVQYQYHLIDDPTRFAIVLIIFLASLVLSIQIAKSGY